MLSSAVEECWDVVGGVAICAGYAVSVDVEGGGRSGVAESLRDGDDGDAVGEHLGGHEMPEVVQPELADTGTAAVIDEHLGNTVRKPRHRAVCFGTEHERLVGQQMFVLGGSLG